MNGLGRDLAGFRTRVATALAPSTGDEWTVHEFPVDAVAAPAYALVWGDPWLEPATHCTQIARLEVVTLAHRVDEPGADLDNMVAYALRALQAAALPSRRTSRPGPYVLGGSSYYAARTTISLIVSV